MDPEVLREAEARLITHRFLYYVEASSVVPDTYYDTMEKQLVDEVPEDSMLRKPGSSNASDYPPQIHEWADWMRWPKGPFPLGDFRKSKAFPNSKGVC